MNAWGVLKQAVKDAPAGATIKITGTIQAATASGNNGELEITKDLTIKPTGSTATLDANSSVLGDNAHRLFNVKGGTLTLNNMTLENGSFANDIDIIPVIQRMGAGIYIQSSGKAVLNNTIVENCDPHCYNGGGIRVENTSADACTIKGSTRIVPHATNETINSVSLADGATINVPFSMTGTDFIALIHPKHENGRKVITGATTDTHKRFLVQAAASHCWIIKANGCLSDQKDAIMNTLNLSFAKAYEPRFKDTHYVKDKNCVVFFKTNKGNYGYMYITDTNDTTNSGAGDITFDFKVYNPNGTLKLQRSNVTVPGNEFYDLDTPTLQISQVSGVVFCIEPLNTLVSGSHVSVVCRPVFGSKFYQVK
ncbi:MAG: hypothetical protein ACTTH8_04735 [Treponema sp.]